MLSPDISCLPYSGKHFVPPFSTPYIDVSRRPASCLQPHTMVEVKTDHCGGKEEVVIVDSIVSNLFDQAAAGKRLVVEDGLV